MAISYFNIKLNTLLATFMKNLINEGRGVMMVKSLRYQLIFPAIVLSLITISFYVIGNVFADAADPRNHV